MARPGNGIFDWLPPMDVEAEIGDGRGGIDGIIGDGAGAPCPGIKGPVLTSVMRVSTRRVDIFHSPHQSSSRTCGQTPSIMCGFALKGLRLGALRRH